MYTFKGLNLRQSEINRPPEFASDCENVQLNSKRELIKRFGYDESLDPSFSIKRIIPYDNESRLLVMSSEATDKLYRFESGSAKEVNYAGDGAGWTDIDFAEYNKVLYITDIAGAHELFKYDGYMLYRAGIPKMSATYTPAAGPNKYYRLAYYFVDGQGNVHFGDYQQFGPVASGGTFTVDTFNATQFWARYGTCSGVPQTINSGNLTLNVTAHNYVAGDFIRYEDVATQTVTQLEVDSVTATTIVFTSASVGAGSFSYSAGQLVEERLKVAVFISDDPTYNYFADGLTGGSVGHAIDNAVGTDTITPAAASGTPMEDIYDTTLIKGLPPKCKYVTIYGETMVLGNRFRAATSTNDVSDYAEDQIFWSDTGVGSTVETFAPFDVQKVGKTSEGNISGLYASENELIIFKDKQVYYASGILIGRAFRLSSAQSAGVGCTYHRSIVEVQDGCLFMSQRGVYFAGGGIRPVEMTDLIEPLFTEDTMGLNLNLVYAVRDTINEKVYFFIPATSDNDDLLLEWDYYHKEWFKHKNFHADAGIIYVNDTIYHASEDKLYVQSSTYTDDGLPISAFYKTHYHHMGFPGLLKKFVRAVIYSISETLSWNCLVQTNKNWKTTIDTDEQIQFTPALDVDEKPLNMSNCRSLALIIKNTSNQGMLVNGYEIEYEMNQELVKGDS